MHHYHKIMNDDSFIILFFLIEMDETKKYMNKRKFLEGRETFEKKQTKIYADH